MFLSCSGNEHDKNSLKDQFYPANEIDLNQGESVFKDELTFMIDIAEDYLLLEQEANDTSGNVYNVYDSESLSFLGSVGKRGQGPGDFYGAQYDGQSEKRNGELLIWVNDPPQYRTTLINLTASLKKGGVVFDKVIKHHPKHNFQNSLFVLNNEDLLGYQPGFIPNTNKEPLHILKGGVEENGSWGQELIDLGEYPELKNLELIEPRGRIEASFNRAFIGIKPDQSRFMVAYKYYDRIDVFDNQGESIVSIRHPERYKEYDAREVYAPEAKSKLKNKIHYYQHIRTSDKYIYALYYNRKMNEFDRDAGGGVEIRVFDWDGNFKYLLKCPDNLLSITVDEKHGYIYSYLKEKQVFHRYKVDGIF